MRELKVGPKLLTIGLATTHMGRIRTSKTPGYYLMELDINNSRLGITKFSSIERATEEYNEVEINKASGIDAVLVSAQSFEALMHAYPNYFANVKEFMDTLTDLIKKYRRTK